MSLQRRIPINAPKVTFTMLKYSLKGMRKVTPKMVMTSAIAVKLLVFNLLYSVAVAVMAKVTPMMARGKPKTVATTLSFRVTVGAGKPMW